MRIKQTEILAWYDVPLAISAEAMDDANRKFFALVLDENFHSVIVELTDANLRALVDGTETMREVMVNRRIGQFYYGNISDEPFEATAQDGAIPERDLPIGDVRFPYPSQKAPTDDR